MTITHMRLAIGLSLILIALLIAAVDLAGATTAGQYDQPRHTPTPTWDVSQPRHTPTPDVSQPRETPTPDSVWLPAIGPVLPQVDHSINGCKTRSVPL